jgi:hypothetical protein
MGLRVAVAGASGYAGGELLRLLAAHPDLEVTLATAHAQAGQPVAAVHSKLVTDLTLGPTDRPRSPAMTWSSSRCPTVRRGSRCPAVAHPARRPERGSPGRGALGVRVARAARHAFIRWPPATEWPAQVATPPP